MSWSFLPELAAAFLEECSLDTDQSVLSNTTPTPDQFYWPDKPTEHSRLSRFGMKCAHLTGVHGEELLTWYREAFLARTSALPAAGQESTASAAVCGEKWPGSLAKYDRDTCSWKTAQLSLLGDSEQSLVTWPRSGLMLDGQCWELPTLERRTDASESGYWPTPVAMDSGSGRYNTSPGSTNKRPTLALMARKKLWPTPQASDNRDRGNASTPAIARRIEAGKQAMLSMTVSSESGRLNPEWVAWLMGWPIGHTSLKPLGMDRFQGWWQQHGECSMYGEAEHV